MRKRPPDAPSLRGVRVPPTLCWDCAWATNPHGNPCPWSDHGQPVEGWTATETGYDPELGTCYRVIACPLFKRDAEFAGMRRVKDE